MHALTQAIQRRLTYLLSCTVEACPRGEIPERTPGCPLPLSLTQGVLWTAHTPALHQHGASCVWRLRGCVGPHIVIYKWLATGRPWRNQEVDILDSLPMEVDQDYVAGELCTTLPCASHPPRNNGGAAGQ